MSALVPYNYGGYSSQIHFGSHKRKNNQHYDQRFLGQQPFIPRLYPTLPTYQVSFNPNQFNYQSSFYSTHRYPMTGYNQFGRSTMSTNVISLNQSNRQHPYGQYMRHMDEIQKRYWKQRANTMPLPRHIDSYSSYNRADNIYQYEKETRFLPYLVYPGQGIPGFGNSGNLGYGYLSNPGYSAGFNPTLANIGRTRNLPPKIRVIFIPTGFSSSQQPCAGALAMPPFTFNRMSQPLCSLPLPPSLPQIASLLLTPLIQQMIMQQYANPVAILPFTPNCSISQPIILGFPQVPQSYIPSTLMPANVPILPSNASSFLFSFNATSSSPQYSNSGYPSTCRACIPQPPPLNIPVIDHFWTQHCSACHHIPADATKPNIRPTNGRSTPLLRHPTIVENAYNPPIRKQKKQYPHTSASVRMRPWSHEMPPLPHGAVIISDQYISRKDSSKTYNFSRKYPVQHPPISNYASRSLSSPTNTTNTNNWSKITLGTKSQKKYEDDKSQSRSKSISRTPLSHSGVSNANQLSSSASSSSSSCSLCIALTANEHKKIDINPDNNKTNLVRKEFTATAHNINLRYNYQIPDLHSVYHNNPYFKSSDTDSTSLSNSDSLPNIFTTKEYKHGRPSSPIYFRSIIEEEEDDTKSKPTLTTTSFQSQQPVTTTIIIRKLSASSSSIISSVSSNQSFDTKEKDADLISMISTITTDQEDESDSIISETF